MTKDFAQNFVNLGNWGFRSNCTAKLSLNPPIDNTILSMVYSLSMDDVQPLLATLRAKGWTNASIADEIGITVNAVEKWQSGDRHPSNSRLILLNQLIKRKRIPPKKRYPRGSRNQGVENG